MQTNQSLISTRLANQIKTISEKQNKIEEQSQDLFSEFSDKLTKIEERLTALENNKNITVQTINGFKVNAEPGAHDYPRIVTVNNCEELHSENHYGYTTIGRQLKFFDPRTSENYPFNADGYNFMYECNCPNHNQSANMILRYDGWAPHSWGWDGTYCLDERIILKPSGHHGSNLGKQDLHIGFIDSPDNVFSPEIKFHLNQDGKLYAAGEIYAEGLSNQGKKVATEEWVNQQLQQYKKNTDPSV